MKGIIGGWIRYTFASNYSQRIQAVAPDLRQADDFGKKGVKTVLWYKLGKIKYAEYFFE